MGVRLTQETQFPEGQLSKLTIHTAQPTAMALRLHVPYWATGYRYSVNGGWPAFAATTTYYVTIQRVWKDGDIVRVITPMHLHTQAMPDDPTMQTIMYGPIVLAGITDSQTPLTPNQRTTSYLREASADPAAWLTPVPGQPLTFTTVGQLRNVTFLPLYKIIDQPYGVYWTIMSPGSALDQIIQRTVDRVLPGNAASEQAHNLYAVNSNTAPYLGTGWRDGSAFGWTLKVLPDQPMSLDVTYWGSDTGARTFDILVNGQIIATQTLNNNKPGQLFDVEYPLSSSLTVNPSSTITVRFQAHPGNNAGGVFGCATLKPAAP